MTAPYRDIPELTRLESGHGLVRIPCEQDVPFTARVRAIVDTAEFRRLSQISQLGLVACVYPGATHSRFEHALGVFHNALRYLAQLGRDPRFGERIDAHAAEVLLAAALLHDIGHWPFCHPIEDLSLPQFPAHEEVAGEFLRDDGELADVLRTAWRIEPREILDVLVSRADTPKLRLLRSILSGPIDIDKMDYLERDSLHAGVPYGRNFDKNRLIQSLVLNETGDSLAISSKGRTAAELMVFARYVMFREVYWHHAVRSATAMFSRAFYELSPHIELSGLLRAGEADFIRQLRGLARGTPCEALVEGVFGAKRVIYKRVVEGSHDQHEFLYEALARKPYAYLVGCAARWATDLSAVVGEPLSPTDLVIDAPPREREVEFKVDIYDLKARTYRPLAEVSPVVKALAHVQFDDLVKRVRLFAHPRLVRKLTAIPDLVPRLQASLERSVS